MWLLKIIASIAIKTENKTKNMRIIPVPTGKPQAAQKRGQKKEKRSKKADNSPAPPLA